jgi:hypothetical protein
VLASRVLRIIFELTRGKVMGGWRTLLNGKLCELYSLPNIMRITESRRNRWAGFVT